MDEEIERREKIFDGFFDEAKIKERMERGEIIHGLDLPDYVVDHNMRIICEQLGITDEDAEN